MDDLVQAVVDEVLRRQGQRPALLVGRAPQAAAGWRFVTDGPYEAVILGSLTAAELLRFPDEASAQALLEGKSVPTSSAEPDKAAAKPRHIVQVGAFVDPNLAQEARMKLERSGLVTYTQISNTPDGPRTRVRLGPFLTRAEADKAAAKARALGLSAAILAL